MSFADDWKALDPKHRYLLIGMIALGGVGIIARAVMSPSTPQSATNSVGASTGQIGPVNPKDPGFAATSVLPQTARNQGLETIVQSVQEMNQKMSQFNSRLDAMEPAMRAGRNGNTPDRSRDALPPDGASTDLDRPLPDSPGPVKFDQPASNKPGSGKSLPEFHPGGFEPGDGSHKGEAAQPAKRQRRMIDMQPDSVSVVAPGDETLTLAVPVNSGIDAVVMTGFNANSAGGTTGQIGAVVSANAVGAPFVTKLKGDVILPNGFRISELGDCALSGTAVAKMNAERALATAEALSCVKPNGEIWESKIKAYAVDNDGTLGIAGKVVSKQGSVLMQAAITGMASGLGAALSPTSISAVNTNAANGSTAGVQLPSLGSVGYTMVGQGLNNATSQLSKFYLQYAN